MNRISIGGRVALARMTSTIVTEWPEDVWRIDPGQSRWPWLARQLSKALERLGATRPYGERYTVFKWTRENARSLGHIIDRRIDLADSLGGDVQVVLLMGIGDFADMARAPEFGQTFQPAAIAFDVPVGFKGKLYDMPVHVCPGLSGIALVPAQAIDPKMAHRPRCINEFR